MGYNKNILKTIELKTVDDKDVGLFLEDIFKKEIEGLGQYKKFYTDTIDEYMKGDCDKNEI